MTEAKSAVDTLEGSGTVLTLLGEIKRVESRMTTLIERCHHLFLLGARVCSSSTCVAGSKSTSTNSDPAPGHRRRLVGTGNRNLNGDDSNKRKRVIASRRPLRRAT